MVERLVIIDQARKDKDDLYKKSRFKILSAWHYDIMTWKIIGYKGYAS